VHSNFSSQPSIIKFWDQLSLPVIKADFLRYLVMLAVGGVYSDIDTSCLLHPDRWIPIDLGAKTVNAIIGIEYDDITYKMFVRPVSFCQWTLMAKPGHPIYETAVQRVMGNLDFLARRKRVALSELTLDKMEVLEATGPGMISDVVIQVLRDQGQNVTWEAFHDQKEPKLFGDVLILPINGFAASQKHSHAGDPLYGEKYVQHHFGRSWYAPEKAGTDADKAASNSSHVVSR
jgi:alpha 1,6-mannosyltransferase